MEKRIIQFQVFRIDSKDKDNNKITSEIIYRLYDCGLLTRQLKKEKFYNA